MEVEGDVLKVQGGDVLGVRVDVESESAVPPSPSSVSSVPGNYSKN